MEARGEVNNCGSGLFDDHAATWSELTHVWSRGYASAGWFRVVQAWVNSVRRPGRRSLTVWSGTGGHTSCNRYTNQVTVTASAIHELKWFTSQMRYVGSTNQRYVSVGFELWGAPANRPYANTKLRDVRPATWSFGWQTRKAAFTVPSNWTIWLKTKGVAWDGARQVALPGYTQPAAIRCTD